MQPVASFKSMNLNNQIIYYTAKNGSNPVKTYLDSLQVNQKAKVFRLFQAYQTHGLTAIVPHTKKLKGSPLWEIRIVGRDSIRVIYVAHTDVSILALHGLIKKSQKTPQKELAVALERLQDWNKRS